MTNENAAPRGYTPQILFTPPAESPYTSSVKRAAIIEARKRRAHVHQQLAGTYSGYRYTVCTRACTDATSSPVGQAQ